jgi:uncharacterized protein (DUF2126 family)
MKQKRGDELVRRLRDRFAPGGFLHHGQGKWYPGESLPRWAYGLYWRRDGQPIWRNPALVADENQRARAYTAEDARAFIAHLAERLGVDKRYAAPGYEDVWYYLWKERRLPVNVDPFDSKLENKEDRARLAKVFEQGLDKVVGYALPLRRDYYTDGSGAWVSGEWFFRPERMYLIPGDSPMGYRLPLDSIPWVVKTDHPFTHELDPWAARKPLPNAEAFSKQRYLVGGREATDPLGYREQDLRPVEGAGDAGASASGAGGAGADDGPVAKPQAARKEVDLQRTFDVSPLSSSPPGTNVSAPWIVRTAMCAEVRGGVLRISCRRRGTSRTTSSWWPRSRTPPPSCRSPC